MSIPPFFSQPCPDCRRRLSIDVENLGFDVSCPHCSAKFTATDQDQASAALYDTMDFWATFTAHGAGASSGQPDQGRRPK